MIDYSERLAELSPDKRALLALDNPLSFGQQRLWFLQRLDPNSSVYNIPSAFSLTGRLDVAALERAVNAIISRHEILRTGFPCVDGQALQMISPSVDFTISRLDLSGLPETAREAEARRLANEEARLPFDLSSHPLMRVKLLRMCEQEHVLLLTMHHIVSDGWSSGVFLNELTAFYTSFASGNSLELPELPIQYADFAEWEQEWFKSGAAEPHLSYWMRQLGGYPQTMELPTDRPRPPLQTHHGARQHFRLPKELSAGLREQSRKQKVTLFMTLLTAFKTLLYRHSGQTDIIVGTPVANRNQIESEGLIGFFINTLPLRTNLSGNPTFNELTAQVREVALGAFMHQQLPFEKLVQELVPQRSLSHAPLVQVMFDLQTVPKQMLELEGLTLGLIEFEGDTTKFDLAISITEHADELSGTIQYNTDIFDEATVSRLAGHYENLLRAAVAEPARKVSELEMLSEAERRQVVEEWNGTEREYEQGKGVHELFEEQAERRGEAVALRYEDEQLSYGELNERANKLAHYLRRLGVKEEQLVGVCMERSMEMVVAVLGVLKAGGAYVPLDPGYPAERLAYMVKDAGISLLLTQDRVAERMAARMGESEGVEASEWRVVQVDGEWERISEESGENLEGVASGGEHLAYVIYTSGSTGRPKGVLIEHGGVFNFVQAQIDTFGLSHESRVLQVASLSFDSSVWELFMALATGASLCLMPKEASLPGAGLIQLIKEQGVTVATLVPSMLAALPEAELPDLKTLIVAGEECPLDVAARWSVGRRFYNGYGPTESTVCATLMECHDFERKLPIGRPINNVRAYVLDEYLKPVAIGVRGELYLASPGLARGYLNLPELTAERFIPDPFNVEAGSRLYRSGDLARRLPGGELEFLGRLDDQVKVRGFRIELGEIESALREHPHIRQAALTVREDSPGEKRLVAYIVTDSGTTATEELRGFLSERLPDYMVPTAFVVLEFLPQTSNGKLDLKALPAPDQSRPELSIPFLAPSTPLEETIAAIWAEALGLEQVGIDDNFFDLGGHSLLAVRVHERICKALATDVALLKLFQYTTVRTLAAFLGQEKESPSVNAQQEQDWAERRKQSFSRQRRMRS